MSRLAFWGLGSGERNPLPHHAERDAYSNSRALAMSSLACRAINKFSRV